MKKFFYLLLALPLAMMAWSCNDDDNDLPDVDLNIEFSGVVKSNGELYVVKGDTLQIESITLINHTNKNGLVGPTNYFFDGLRIGYNPISPYNFGIVTDNLPVGRHTLVIDSNVLVDSYPVCFAVAQYKVNIVEDKADIPSDAVTPSPEPANVKVSQTETK